MRSFRTISAPRLRLSEATATRAAERRLLGPSAEMAVLGRIEPTITTGFSQLTVASRR